MLPELDKFFSTNFSSFQNTNAHDTRFSPKKLTSCKSECHLTNVKKRMQTKTKCEENVRIEKTNQKVQF